MKITISYQPGEERTAGLIASFVKGFLAPDFTIKRSMKHPPHRHIYITSKPPVPDDGDGG